MKIKSILLKNTINIILLGLLIRCIIAPFTLNWDLLANTRLTSVMFDHPLTEVYKSPLGTFPVLTFYTVRFFLSPVKLLVPGFLDWRNFQDLTSITYPYIFRILFIYKFPIILLEIATAYLFSKILDNKISNKFLLLWMINPISLYTITAFTNVDIFPIFFAVLSLYFFYKKHMSLSAFFLGLGASYKLFPIFFLPFLFFSGRSWRNRIIDTLLFFLPFIITQIPALGISGYWQNVYASGGSKTVFNTILYIGENSNLILFLFIYFLVFADYISSNSNKEKYFVFVFLSLLPMYIVSAIHPQWLYWILPILIYYLAVIKNSGRIFFLLSFSYFGIILLSQFALHLGMLAPIDPSLWLLDRPLNQILGKEIFFLNDILHTIFSAGIAFTGYQLYKNKNLNIKNQK